MGKLYSLISALLLTVSATFAAVPDSYEWWFDHDVSSAQTGSVSGSSIDLQIDTSDLPKGIHYFNLRLAEGDSINGPVFRKMFHSFGRDNGAISYEYWYDNNYASKVTGAIDVGSNHLELDISSLPQGAHYFNCRVGYGDGSWGSVYRKMVLNLAGSVNAVAYEYWIDNDYSAKTEGSLSSGANSYTVDLDGVRKGLHRFNYRLQTGEGMWGSVYTKYFYIASNAARFTEYEYWLDNDFDNRKSATVTSNPVSFEVDLSGFDKSGNTHFFHLRTRDGDGEWSPIYRKVLVFNKTEKRVPIIGYRNFVNGVDIGYVEVERQLADSYAFEVTLPDSIRTKVRNLTPLFEGDKVSLSGTDTLVYVMHPKTEFGWAAPKQWKLPTSNPFSTTAVEMSVNSRQTFNIPSIDKFVAVKFTSESDSLYFRADIPIALDLYKNGKKVAELSAEEIAEIAMIKMEAGTYFGILRDAEKTSESGKFTFHIMDTPNAAPMPVISYEDGMISMSCSRSDAKIHYTLDNEEPTLESPLYEAPFQLKRNAMIKAKAFVPDSDIDPSEIAEFVVDTYKTATPTGVFDMPTRTLTLSCETEGATISYRIGSAEEWTDYTAPFTIGRNCTVYAKASFEGYNDSDVAEIAVTGFPDSMPQPTITFADGMVTITCERSDAEIRYTLDKTAPTKESTLYEGPFALTRNATVWAIAYIPNSEIEPSEIAEYVVDSYQAATPTGVFDMASRTMTLSCETEGASISYRIGASGEWIEYTAPFTIGRNCTVYAKASFDGYNDSDVAEIIVTDFPDTMPQPTISFADGMVTITCERNDAEIHYTINGTDPTKESTLYTAPFAISRNLTIKAIAFIPNSEIEPSEIAEYVVDSYKTATPTGVFDMASRTMTLSCETEGASISYRIDASGEWIEYTAPFTIGRNCTVYAKASFDGYNDSDEAEIAVTDFPDTMPQPTISFADGMVTITCERNDAEIHYTINGTDPTKESTLYTAPFAISRNLTIKAIAFIPNSEIEPSEIAEFVVDSFKTATPTGTFDMESRTMTLSCETEGASISYRIGVVGDWIVYTGPFTVGKNTTVYATATAEGYADSDVAQIAVTGFPDSMPQPTITFSDGMVTITCERSDAEIRYTLDKTAPTKESTLYEGPFKLSRNATVWAIAYIPNSDLEPSEISELVVDSYKTATPTGNFDSDTSKLTLECETEGATISYSFDPNDDWTVYTGPITIESNCTVYAKAVANGYNESEILVIEVGQYQCAPVAISYNGRYVTLKADDPEVEIRYSLDGTDPLEGKVFTGEFDVKGLQTATGSCTVKAIAIKDGYKNSEISEHYIYGYADEYHAETVSEGVLSSCFGWNIPDSFEEFRVEGKLNDTDFAYLKTLNGLRHLDIENVKEAKIPDSAFRNSKLVSISMPSDLVEYGDSILSGCANLCGIIWNSTKMHLEARLTSGVTNPNVLFYVSSVVNVEDEDSRNVIVDDVASEVTLHDEYPFDVSREFTARKISFTRKFDLETPINGCSGWESLVLPFTPDSIVHERAGRIVPFDALEEDEFADFKPFWLYRSNSSGWEGVKNLEGGVPYIISMPNNEEYIPEYILSGNVTFLASDVTLTPESVSPETTSWVDNTQFVGSFLPVEEAGIRSLNVNGEDGETPGSAFVEEATTKPFGAYIRGARKQYMPVFGNWNAVLLPSLGPDGLKVYSPAPGTLKISSNCRRKVNVTTMTGVILRSIWLSPGETVTIESLTRDIYIVGGMKVVVK